jgi:hypothetical protein
MLKIHIAFMRRFILNITLYFLGLFGIAAIALYISSAVVESRDFQIYEGESNLFFIDKEQEYDLLFMGISHARNFSRSKNHIRLERTLNKRILNIGIGEGKCGVNEQHFYLKYFYQTNNKAGKLIYVLSPPMFFSKTLPVASNTFDAEPFKTGFFLRYLFYPAQNKRERILSYIRSKFSKEWFEYRPWSLNANEAILDSIDWKAVGEGEKIVYGDSLDLRPFNESAEQVERSIELALKNRTEVLLIITPAIFGKWKGHNEVVEFGQRMALKQGVSFYDFSEVMTNPVYYSDHHHLNSRGIDFFTREYLSALVY